jgi:hypothetical protein
MAAGAQDLWSQEGSGPSALSPPPRRVLPNQRSAKALASSSISRVCRCRCRTVNQTGEMIFGDARRSNSAAAPAAPDMAWIVSASARAAIA